MSSGYKNTAKEKRSAGDGSFRQDVLTPLLSGLSSLIASGDIDVNNFSWSEVCDKFDFHSDKYHWAVFSRLISRKNEIGDFQTNCIRLLTIIEDYADTVDTPLLVVQMALKKYLEENPLPSIAPN